MSSLTSYATYYLRDFYTGAYATANGVAVVPATSRVETSFFYQWRFVPNGQAYAIQNVGSHQFCSPNQGDLHDTYTGLTMISSPYVATVNPDSSDPSLYNINFGVNNDIYHFTDTSQPVLYAVTDAYKDSNNPTFNDKRRTQWILERSRYSLPNPNKTYYLKDTYTGKYATANGASVVPSAATPGESNYNYQWKFVLDGAGYSLQNVGSGQYCAPALNNIHDTYTGLTMQPNAVVTLVDVEPTNSGLYYINFVVNGATYHFTDTDQPVLYAVTDAYKDSNNPTFNDKRRTQWVLQPVS